MCELSKLYVYSIKQARIRTSGTAFSSDCAHISKLCMCLPASINIL